MIEARFMLAELEHAPKIGVRGDVYSPQIRKTGKPLLHPSAALRAVTTGVTTADFRRTYIWLSL